MKLISVIVPIYNVENYLEETIISILQQTYTNLEIILVNDGSSDNSAKICDNFTLKDERVIVIHKKNGGLSSARNAGINIAKGDYIFFLDGDDFIKEDTLEILLNNFDLYDNIGIVSAPCFLSYRDGYSEIFREDWNIKSLRIIKNEAIFLKALSQEICFSACCKLYKRILFDEIRFREGKRNEDTLFMFDISYIMEKMQFNMLEIPDKLYYYRVNYGSISRDLSRPLQFYYIENLQLLISEAKSKALKQTLKFLYYKELILFKTTLLSSSKEVNSNIVEQTNKFFNKVELFDLIKHSSLINVTKYLILKYIPFIYLVKIKIINKNK